MVIEGDGRAHDHAGRPSADPTPRNPQGLRIARAWPAGPVVWIARPCQFTRRTNAACRPQDWTTDRFAPEALAALDAAVDQAKAQAGASRLVLAGWSGGGVIAAALARRRGDVAGLVTFAAPLDVASWTRRQGLSPLRLAPETASLAVDSLPVPQLHLLGSRDQVTPPRFAVAAARRLGGDRGHVEIAAEGHACCWEAHAAYAAARLRNLPPP